MSEARATKVAPAKGHVPGASADDWRRLVECVEDYAIFMLDEQGYVKTWSPGAEKTKGYAAHEILGRHFSVFYPEEDRLSDKPGSELRVAAQEGRVEDEGWRLRKDGTRFWANVVISALRDDDGSLFGFAKITRDLTARRRAEEALRRSEERMRLLVESVSDYAIYMLSPSGEVSTWNAGAQKLKGYTAGEIIGQHYSRFFLEEDVAAGKPQRELDIARETGRFEEEGFRVRKGGDRFWANVVLTRVVDAQGTLIGFAKVTRDLTSRLSAQETAKALAMEQAARAAAELAEQSLRVSEQRMREAARTAEDANRIKDEFLGIVSHELRTPLNAILGWAAILRGRRGDPSLEKAIEVIHRNAVSQSKIIDDILDVSRIISGKLSLELKPMDICAVVRDALEAVRPSAEAKRIALELQEAPPDCLMVGDPQRLQQVFWNFLSNAVKFSDPGGRVRVVIERSRGHLSVCVSDQGRGIKPEFLPFVFDRFVQADSSSARRVGGLGLGLAIARQLVELHGGEVQAESPGLGQGATFRARIPERAVIPEPHTPAESWDPGPFVEPKVAGTLEGKRVLVVDDEQDARELVHALLSQAGATVEMASSAADAFARVGDFRPHVLVSDIGMPGEDGYSLAQRVRALAPELGGGIPSLALTAYTRPQDKSKALSMGFANHIGKPVRPEDSGERSGQLGGVCAPLELEDARA
ncbi:MAG: PAS domain S-box protein [Myxococcales bacterium]